MRHRPALAALVAALVVVGRLVAPGADVTAASPPWTGSVDLYRSGTFTTQRSWLWCTAANVQIMRNIVDGATDHSKANQRRYFRYMRARNRYDIPVSDGVDPVGWAAGLRHYVDGRYELTTSSTFASALRTSVTNLRTTDLPVGITVAHGNHAWILTGFSATADPAVTTDFRVTSVRVVGPLWDLQSRSDGYDMRPNTTLTTKAFKRFFTAWHYDGIRMAWEGRWVSIQPVAADPVAIATGSPLPFPSSAPTERATPTRSAGPWATPSVGQVAVNAPSAAAGPDDGRTVRPDPGPAVNAAATPDGRSPVLALLLVGAAIVGILTAAAVAAIARRRP